MSNPNNRYLLVHFSWGPVFRDMSEGEYVEFLKRLARGVDFQLYPKAHRGSEKERPKRHYDPTRPHDSVAKILAARNRKAPG